jgi:hypothetical protein
VEMNIDYREPRMPSPVRRGVTRRSALALAFASAAAATLALTAAPARAQARTRARTIECAADLAVS